MTIVARNTFVSWLLLLAAVLSPSACLARSAEASDLQLDPFLLRSWKHIQFEDIPANSYLGDGEALKVEVKQSSSFLLKPFAAVQKIKYVQFEWKSSGKLNLKSATKEKTKAGDDSLLRVGLLMSGPAPTLPMFAPTWIKIIRDSLKHPSDKLLYLVVGAKSPVGTRWQSPYSDSMTMQVVKSTPLADHWQSVSVSFPKALDLVGLWVMADGDDTKSSFVTEMRRLKLDP